MVWYVSGWDPPRVLGMFARIFLVCFGVNAALVRSVSLLANSSFVEIPISSWVSFHCQLDSQCDSPVGPKKPKRNAEKIIILPYHDARSSGAGCTLVHVAFASQKLALGHRVIRLVWS